MGKQKKSTLSDVKKSGARLNNQAMIKTKAGFSNRIKPEPQPKKSDGFGPTKVPL